MHRGTLEKQHIVWIHVFCRGLCPRLCGCVGMGAVANKKCQSEQMLVDKHCTV